ncbi:MAG: acetyl-CoA carboxylase carboxyltransferase subunit alpha [Cyanobacteria bacterium P01_E01_bin.34]
MAKASDRMLLSFEKPVADLERRIEEIRSLADENELEASDQIRQLEQRAAELRKEIFLRLTPSQRLQVARHPRRPSTLDYIQTICDDWFEMHGDRHGCDDRALVVGLGRLEQRPVVLLGHQKGRDTKDNVLRNFGMPNPAGYRKALRLIRHANRFRLPILTLIDTPGAYPGIEAEECGQGEAIAVNLRELFEVEVPVICTIIGEGGSGGALAIGVGNRVLMFEHSVYSVISPEGCAAILWKDASKASRAAEALKITAKDLLGMGIIDEILPEPIGGAHKSPLTAAEALKKAWSRHLNELTSLSGRELREERYQKFRKMGVFIESRATAG